VTVATVEGCLQPRPSDLRNERHGGFYGEGAGRVSGWEDGDRLADADCLNLSRVRLDRFERGRVSTLQLLVGPQNPFPHCSAFLPIGDSRDGELSLVQLSQEVAIAEGG
jgi:hypothetical protein